MQTDIQHFKLRKHGTCYKDQQKLEIHGWFHTISNLVIEDRGGFRGGGGGGGRTPPPSGIRPPADPKGPPFDTFSEIHFWRTDPKIFLKAPIYTNFEGERAPKKNAIFLSKFFKKCPKTAFFDCFFKNLPAAQKILPK